MRKGTMHYALLCMRYVLLLMHYALLLRYQHRMSSVVDNGIQ
jgi:hypothetical protein